MPMQKIPEYLLFSFAQSGIIAAKEILFERYKRTIASVVAKVCQENPQAKRIIEDLYSAGRLGLIEAINTHQYFSANQDFKRYAWYVIKREVISETKTLLDYEIVGENAFTSEDIATSYMQNEQAEYLKKSVMEILGEKEYLIFADYYGIGTNQLTRRQILQKYSLNAPQFREIIAKISEKLKEFGEKLS